MMGCYVCKLCGGLIQYDDFEWDIDEDLWGHLNLEHEEKHDEVKDWETPFMIEECYDEVPEA